MILTFDTETFKKETNGNYEPILDATGEHFVLGAILKETGGKCFFTDKNEMWRKILELGYKERKRGKRLVVYGHNIKYDFFQVANLKDKNIRYYCESPFIASYYVKDEKTFERKEFESWEKYAKTNNIPYKILAEALNFVTIEYDLELIKFLDSMSIFRMGVERLGEKLGLEKLEMPEIGKKLTKSKMEELKEYCIRDCEVVMKGILMLKKKLMKDDINIRNICTISQVAISYLLNELKKEEKSENILYRNKKGYLTEWVHKTRYPEDIHNAYRGGFVRAWKLGKHENVNAVDCNSLYPYSAMKMRFPDLRTERKIFKPLEIYDKNDLFNKIGVSKIMIKNEKDDLGLLMIRTPTKGYVPLEGKYIIGTWTHTEIKKALEVGYKLINVEWSILWDESENVLKGVFKKLYNRRVNAEDEFNYMLYKDIMNRSIGKFGQHRIHGEIFIDNVEEIEKYLNDKYLILRGVSDNSYDLLISKKPEKIQRKKYYTPIIPALITAEARCYMYDNYNRIPRRRLLYTDTDSIIWSGTKEEVDLFNTGDGLGQFKIEKDEITGKDLINSKCLIWGTKSKSIGNNIAVAGAFKKGITMEGFEKGEVLIKRMTGLKQGNVEEVGKFIEEKRDLNDQKEEFIREKNMMDSQEIYIDENITDVSFFKDDLSRVLHDNKV